MNETAQLIADLVRAGTDPDLIGRVAATIANVRQVDEQAERRRAADRVRKAAYRSELPQTSADSADKKGFDKEIPHTPLEITSKKINTTRGRKSDLPDDWEPDAKTWTLADELGFTSQEAWDQLQRMRDWAKNADGGKGRKSDWNAAFRNWLKRASDDKRSKPNRNSTANTLDALDAAVDATIRRKGGLGESSDLTDSEKLSRLWESAA